MVILKWWSRGDLNPYQRVFISPLLYTFSYFSIGYRVLSAQRNTILRIDVVNKWADLFLAFGTVKPFLLSYLNVLSAS